MTNGGSLIHGRAHRTDGSAVAEARVFFSAAPVSVPDVALLTDERGNFTLHAPVPGRYEVACHAEDFEPRIIPIDVPDDNDAVHIDIELTAVIGNPSPD